MTISELRSELINDPAGLGYAPLVSGGFHLLLADKLNATGQESISVGDCSKNKFLLNIVVPALLGLASKSPEVQAKWTMVKEVVLAAEGFYLKDPMLAGLIQSAVTDGVLTQQQVDAVTKRLGSRAEVLWGDRTIVTVDQIAEALK